MHLGEVYCCFQDEVFHEYIFSSDEWWATWLSWKLITENKEKYSKIGGGGCISCKIGEIFNWKTKKGDRNALTSCLEYLPGREDTFSHRTFYICIFLEKLTCHGRKSNSKPGAETKIKKQKQKQKNDILTLLYCFSFLKKKKKAFYHIPFLSNFLLL